jgi:hypothetical protein
MKLTLLTLLILVGCAKTPEEISAERQVPIHTVLAFQGWCGDKGGASFIKRIGEVGEGRFYGRCKDESYLYFKHGDVLFQPQEEHNYDEPLTDEDAEVLLLETAKKLRDDTITEEQLKKGLETAQKISK